ncbi:MAG TPA: hypothetical protein VFR81_29905 [Longimicrobium sp.]|nr:hypothetical protein [Longimicrobium sp.]
MNALVVPMAALALASCGGAESTISLRGDFPESDAMPTRVLAVEAQREAEVSGGAFSLAELTAGPATLLFLRDTDTVGAMSLGNLRAGAEVELRGLRVDEATGRAFPASLEAAGAEMVTVNGVRMAPERRLPRRVDAAGTVLAVSDAADALLLRPDDASIPDLRVVIDPGTETVSPDGDPVPAENLAPGDSVRVEGATHRGLVLATRLTVPRRVALTEAVPVDGTASSSKYEIIGGGGSSSSASGAGSAAAAGAAAPAARRVLRDIRDRGNDRAKERGNGRGTARGGGNGRAKGGGKKN